MSKWASSVIKPTLSSGKASASTAGLVIALLPPARSVRRVVLKACFDSVADRLGCFLDRQAVELDVAAVADWGEKRVARFDVITSNPLQGPA